jgi:hypothetical protein
MTKFGDFMKPIKIYLFPGLMAQYTALSFVVGFMEAYAFLLNLTPRIISSTEVVIMVASMTI